MNTPAEIAAGFAALGEKKTDTAAGRLFLLAVLAGMFIAFAGVGSTIGSAAVNRLAGACVFPAGLAMVVVAGSELFTGDCLMIVSVLEKHITAGQMLKTLGIVYLGNLAGAVLTAAAAVFGGSADAFAQNIIATAAAKAALPFGGALLRGIACNILVCAAVWMAASAKDTAGKLVGLYLPIMLFVLCGFEHSVANMYYLPAGLFAAAKAGIDPGFTAGAALWRNLVPVTLGNMIGGMGFGAVYWRVYLKK